MKKLGSKIDLSKLPAPKVVEAYSSEHILGDMKAYYLDLVHQRYPRYQLRDTDPACRLLEAAAYRASLIYQRVNDAVKECFLSHSQGSNLDQIGGLFDVLRDGQSDEELRNRILLSYDRFSTAGSEGAYRYHALEAGSSLGIVDCRAFRDTENSGVVKLVLLFADHDDKNLEEKKKKVEQKLNAPDIKPLNETLSVQLARIKTLQLKATVFISDEFDAKETKGQILESLDKLKKQSYKIGKKIPLSVIYAALSVPRVVEVRLKEGFETIDTSSLEAAPMLSFSEESIVVKRASEVADV